MMSWWLQTNTSGLDAMQFSRFRFSSAVEVFWASLRWRIYWLVAAVVLDVAFHDHVAEGVTELEGFEELHWSLRAFVKWDAAHLLNIATRGYTKDMESVFLPLYPTVLWYVSHAFNRYLLFGDSIINAVVISALGVNLLLYPLSSVLLWKLMGSWGVSSNLKIIAVTVQISLNPANAFFVSCYSETMFSVLTWLSMYLLSEARISSWATKLEVIVATILASLTRSNGFVNACLGLNALLRIKGSSPQTVLAALLEVIMIGLSASVPLITIDMINDLRYCNQGFLGLTHSESCATFSSESSLHSLNLSSDVQKYVDRASSSQSSYYSYVQKKYWGVDLFASYRWIQIPNIIIAMPAIAIAGYVLFISRSCRHRFKVEKLHLALHLFLGVTLAHIQITTRLLMCACPLMYLGIAEILGGNSSEALKTITVAYLALYSVAGVGLHVNWYPWT